MLRRNALVTFDHRPLEVESPGILNEGSGPDFHGARVRIGGTFFVGDIELHRNVAEWMRHGHQTDPAYNGVILHVVLEGDPLRFPTLVQSGRAVPVLVASSFLNPASQRWIAGSPREGPVWSLPCEGRTGRVGGRVLSRWIEALADERLEFKVRRLEERLRELAFESQRAILETAPSYHRGAEDEIPVPEIAVRDLAVRHHWDQVLYEGIMDGLGYARNRRPFLLLARSVTLERLQAAGVDTDPLACEALLLGAADLLPDPSAQNDPQARLRTKVLRELWEDLRGSVPTGLLSRSDWSRSPLRPSNAPESRIVAAARLIGILTQQDLFRRIVKTFKEAEGAPQLLRTLVPALLVKTDRSTSSGRPANLLGRSRATDIVANTFIPLVLLYARIFHAPDLRSNALDISASFPPLAGNNVLRFMARHLTGTKVRITTLRRQQGLLQLHGLYCREDRCSECAVGRIVFKKYIGRS